MAGRGELLIGAAALVAGLLITGLFGAVLRRLPRPKPPHVGEAIETGGHDEDE